MSHNGEDSDGFQFEMDEQMSPPNVISSTDQMKTTAPLAGPVGRPDLVDSGGKIVAPSGRAILASSEGASAFAIPAPPNPVIQRFNELREADPELGVVLVVTKTMASLIADTTATTNFELLKEIESASDVLRAFSNSIGVHFGVELFRRLVGDDAVGDFAAYRKDLVARATAFVERSRLARDKIAGFAQQFIKDDMTVLTHGYSRAVLAVFETAVRRNKRFRVIVTEARPTGIGYLMVRKLQELGLAVTLVVDSAVAHVMNKVDAILCGAEGILENGGVINSVGTYGVAIIAHALKKPMYVCAESFKFSRKFYPLDQRDIQQFQVRQKLLVPPYVQQPHAATTSCRLTQPVGKGLPVSAEALATTSVLNPSIDWTPPQYITLLFTDLGPLSSSAVSDELIKLYF